MSLRGSELLLSTTFRPWQADQKLRTHSRSSSKPLLVSVAAHLGGVPWARIGEHVGQRNLAVTANTYTHVLIDESEIDYATLLVS